MFLDCVWRETFVSPGVPTAALDSVSEAMVAGLAGAIDHRRRMRAGQSSRIRNQAISAYHPNRKAAPLCLSPACTTSASVFRPNWKIP